MKLRFFLLIIILGNVFHPLKAQLKVPSASVGSKSADSSAILDVVSTTQGVLVPRVYLTGPKDDVTIKRPANSLLVYNTNSSLVGARGSGQGFFYNYGSKESPEWVKLGSAEPKKNTNGYTLRSFYSEECEKISLIEENSMPTLKMIDSIAISSPENCVVVHIQQCVVMDSLIEGDFCNLRLAAAMDHRIWNSESFTVKYSIHDLTHSSSCLASYTFVFKNLPVGNFRLECFAIRDRSEGSAVGKPLKCQSLEPQSPPGNITVSVYEKG